MTDIENDQYHEWDAAYVLGSLSASDRRLFERHLAGCEVCKESVAELAGMPGLLSKVPAGEATALLQPVVTEPLPATLLPRMVRSARRRQRRQRGLIAGGIATAAAAAAAVVLVLPMLFGHAGTAPIADPTPTAKVIALSAVIPNPLTADIRLTSVGWGTRIEMNCHYGEPAGASDDPSWTAGASVGYAMYVTDMAGRATQVATWWAKPGSTVEPSGTTSLALSEIASIDVRSMNGTVLLSAAP